MSDSSPRWTELDAILDRVLDGLHTDEDAVKLNEILRTDANACRRYVSYMELHGRLAWEQRADEETAIDDDQDNLVGEPSDLFAAIDVSAPIIVEPAATIEGGLSSGHSSLRGWLLSYAAATAIMCVAILGAWVYKVSHDTQVATAPRSREATVPGANSPRVANSAQDARETVARITAMFGCQWTDNAAAPAGVNEAIVRGRRYALSSGYLEIAYGSGAKVILQGPCVYEVESERSGFLSLGKLTACVESAVGSRQTAVGSQPLPTAHSSLPARFVVRTPTAVITDLGTEFGVEVDKSGATLSQVFRGKVGLRAIGGGEGDAQVIFLEQNESARVERAGDQEVKAVKLVRTESRLDRFARQLPKRMRIKLFNTGIDLKEGEEDPHWHLVARSDDPHFRPRPAVVTTTSLQWRNNAPYQSQWISLVGDASEVPDLNTVYTFRTTFTLSGMVPSTARIDGQLLVDNFVRAIRLNGHDIPPPEHDDDCCTVFRKFTMDREFIEGTNVLEIEVVNGSLDNAVKSSPMGLRVELNGSAMSEPADIDQPATTGIRPADRWAKPKGRSSADAQQTRDRKEREEEAKAEKGER
ncbi:MAG: hypothetical protein ABFC96_11750 [Thermoguttaceae bacterium]